MLVFVAVVAVGRKAVAVALIVVVAVGLGCVGLRAGAVSFALWFGRCRSTRSATRSLSKTSFLARSRAMGSLPAIRLKWANG